LFPLKEDVTVKQIDAALNKLSTVGMVQVYMYDQKPFLQLTAWNVHQQIRSQKSKFPAPEEYEDKKGINWKLDINCNQMISIAPVIQSNPIQSEYESESESNPNPKKDYCAEQLLTQSSALEDSTSSASLDLPAQGENPAIFIAMPLIGGTEHPVSQAEVDQWAELYPAVDVPQVLREIKGWSLANPKKRKTKTGVNRFINAWLAREQNKGHPSNDRDDPNMKGRGLSAVNQRGSPQYRDEWGID
jgi:hypothetical protein